MFLFNKETAAIQSPVCLPANLVHEVPDNGLNGQHTKNNSRLGISAVYLFSFDLFGKGSNFIFQYGKLSPNKEK